MELSAPTPFTAPPTLALDMALLVLAPRSRSAPGIAPIASQRREPLTEPVSEPPSPMIMQTASR
jgi:hypothetical protein